MHIQFLVIHTGSLHIKNLILSTQCWVYIYFMFIHLCTAHYTYHTNLSQNSEITKSQRTFRHFLLCGSKSTVHIY